MTNHPSRNWRKRATEGLPQWRARRGLTQTEAGKLVGVSLRTWQSWEAGERKPPEMLWILLEKL